MPKITVATPFTFTDGEGKQHNYDAGVHTVDAAHADHWYVKAHCVADVKKAKDAPVKSEGEKQAEAMATATAEAAAKLDGAK